MKKLLLIALFMSSFGIANCMDGALSLQLSDEVVHGDLLTQINLHDEQAKALFEVPELSMEHSIEHLRELVFVHYELAKRLCQASEALQPQLLHKMICARSAILETTTLESIIYMPPLTALQTINTIGQASILMLVLAQSVEVRDVILQDKDILEEAMLKQNMLFNSLVQFLTQPNIKSDVLFQPKVI